MSVATLEGKRVLVVGASSGIGRAVALRAVRSGASVVMSARRSDRLAELVHEDDTGQGFYIGLNGNRHYIAVIE